MNQQINEQLEELKKRVEKLEQQQTEPIKVTIERRQTETERMIDDHTALLKEISTEQEAQSDLLQTIFTTVGMQNTDIAMLKHEMQGARADIIAIKATQSDHGEMLKNMATKDDIAELKGDITNLKGDITNLKGDITNLKGDITSIKATQDQILQLLQRSGESHHDL